MAGYRETAGGDWLPIDADRFFGPDPRVLIVRDGRRRWLLDSRFGDLVDPRATRYAVARLPDDFELPWGGWDAVSQAAIRWVGSIAADEVVFDEPRRAVRADLLELFSRDVP